MHLGRASARKICFPWTEVRTPVKDTKAGGEVCSAMARVEKMGDEVGDRGGRASDADGLEGAAEDTAAEQTAFKGAEEGEGDQRDQNGDTEGRKVVFDEHVGPERDEAAGDVGEGDGKGGAAGLGGCRLFEAELKAHHEVDPGVGVGLEREEDGFGAGAGDVVLLEDLVDFFLLVAGAFEDFAFFAEALGGVVLGIAAGGEIAAETHGDGAGGDLGQAREDDQMRGGDGARETGGQGEGDGEAIGEADHDVADGLAGLEVLFLMGVGLVRVRRVKMRLRRRCGQGVSGVHHLP